MSNVLSEEKKQQVIALGRLGWPLRRIEQETGVRRETAGAYLKAAGIGVRPPGAWGRRAPAKPANAHEVITGFGVELSDSGPKDPKHALSTSFCEPFRDAIELPIRSGITANYNLEISPSPRMSRTFFLARSVIRPALGSLSSWLLKLKLT
jgi:hypothetical protein